MQKNKIIHEDIKAVCSSATKKLVAAGLIAATTVGGANFASNNCKNIACAQPPKGNKLNKPEEKKLRQLTEEEAREVIAKGLGNYSSWEDLCADNNFAFDDLFFEAEANRLMALMNARTEEIEEAFEKAKENFEKQQEEIKELQIKIDENGIKISKNTARILAYYEHNPDKGKWEFTGDNYLNIDDVSLQRFGSHSEKIETAANAYSLRHRLDYLRERIRDYNRRLEGGLLSFVRYSQRYNEVETSLQPQTPEPPRYDIEQAPAYVEWATPEVERLEQLARGMQQQLLDDLRIDIREQADFEDRMCWFNPQGDIRMLPWMAATDSLDDFLDESRQVTEAQQRLQHIMEENLAFYSQPYTPPALTNNDNEATQNDNNLVHNNQIEEIVEIREVVEEPEDLNMINNNQIEEIQEVTNEQDNNNLINNNQQQRPILHIAPLNVPAPQQGNGIVGGTIKFIGNAVSFFNPFSKK